MPNLEAREEFEVAAGKNVAEAVAHYLKKKSQWDQYGEHMTNIEKQKLQRQVRQAARNVTTAVRNCRV